MKHFRKMLSIFLMAVVVMGTMIPVFGANAQMRPATGNLIIHRYDYDHSYTLGSPNHGEEVTITGATPLKDVVFNIYSVPTTTSYPSEGTVTVDKISNTTKFTDSEGKVFNVTFKTSATTNASGTATINDLPKGVYLVVEQTNLNISTQSYPYIVSVPMTEEDGDGWITNVHSYPKNGKSIAIEKTLKSEPDVSIGDIATWEIKALTGDAVKESKQYIIKDNSITNLSSTVLEYTDTVSIKDDKGNVVPTSNSNVTPNVAPSAPAENKVVSLTYDVNLINPGDVYEFEVDVVNAGRIDAVIEMFTSTIKVGDGPEQLVSTENIPSYLDYSVQYKDGSAIQTNGVIDAGDSKKIVVHVGLKSSVTQEELSALEGTTIALNLGMSYKQK